MITKRDLTDAECTTVADLYRQMLACRNRVKGEHLANQIDEIIRLATYTSLEKINLLIHRVNLPMMMKDKHVTDMDVFDKHITDRDVYYTVNPDQIGTYPPNQGHASSKLNSKKPTRV